MPVFTYYASPKPTAPPTPEPGRPRAAYSYSAASLAGLSAGAGVVRWPNQGFEARPFDLYPTGGAPQAGAYYPAAAGLPAYVRCQSDIIMQSLNSLPDSLCARYSRTMGLKYRVFGDNVNLAGYGAPGSQGSLFDLLAFQGGLLTPHYFGGQVVGPSNAQGQFITRVIRLESNPDVDAGTVSVQVLDGAGGLLLATAVSEINTGTGSGFYLLGGSYGAYNTTAVRDIAGAFLAAGALSTDQILTELSYL